ncbi:NAD(P)H-dependent oxidoreductase [Staphylococcus gallinarum]|uniref:NAD(P)H-dependent oxidoreductase n=1 Tax=Staphylococcus gallinarum TaxID=1293 RepID=UPI000D1C77D3|nr:NAD(P)H-dependent oxidoreductase [Staphylococcus gallinarum]MBU7217685.1 NAD(P)H-dependent oxidoreductase [Staphylococcus gallinarum]MCD8899699.1 NAD(P)H-dependent oxidoreductase [Staphylococcus gallinarum]MCD8920070.1 NAD(P)H-dependent oxidoreductase [Staphylococcus gallinarum]PTE32412.1 NAD(P)H oxidoreductase [Staphylococcus gallinarum]RIO82220.1 flavodoxin family protein [Staphylococcus gallinarum]
MKTLVLVFHPNLEESRVNRAIAEGLEHSDDVIVRRMYDLYPDFKIDVAEEQKHLAAADRIILQFPFYWYSTPALLKQWQDDVLTYGWAFGSTGTQLHGKELLVSTTTGAVGYQRDGEVKYTVEELLRPLQATSNLIGTKYLRPFILNNALAISEEEINAYVEQFKQYITTDQELLGLYE